MYSPRFVREVLVDDPCVLVGNAYLCAGNYGPSSILNGALKPPADALPESLLP